MPDSARAYLRTHGYPSHVVEGGLAYLLARWEGVAKSVSAGEVQYQDDYLNDVDGRHTLAEMLADLSSDQRSQADARIATADTLMRPHLLRTESCLWGEENERTHSYRRELHWWYYHRPRIVDETWRDF